MRVAFNEGKRIDLDHRLPALPNEPVNDAEPEGTGEQQSEENAPRGAQRIVGLFDDVVGLLDGFYPVEGIDSADGSDRPAPRPGVADFQVLEWPICDGPSGHIVLLSKGWASRF